MFQLERLDIALEELEYQLTRVLQFLVSRLCIAHIKAIISKDLLFFWHTCIPYSEVAINLNILQLPVHSFIITLVACVSVCLFIPHMR